MNNCNQWNIQKTHMGEYREITNIWNYNSKCPLMSSLVWDSENFSCLIFVEQCVPYFMSQNSYILHGGPPLCVSSSSHWDSSDTLMLSLDFFSLSLVSLLFYSCIYLIVLFKHLVSLSLIERLPFMF
jgi:hypothetical protein